MPELPEIRHITEILNEALRGKSILNWEILPTSKFRDGFPGMELLALPLGIESVTFRGKRILFNLEGKLVIVSFLSLEGKWSWQPSKYTSMALRVGTKKSRLVTNQRTLYYSDSRKFGTIQVVKREDLDRVLKNVGPDYFNEEIDEKRYIAEVRRRDTTIDSFLMDQTRFSGVGNYLRAEILYLSGIRPTRRLSSISDDELRRILSSTYTVMNKAYEKRGLTLATYSDPDGNIGEYSPMVYGRKEDDSGNPIETYRDSSRRTVHWVPNVQH